MTSDSAITFTDLGLSNLVLKALNAVGYEHPTPIQAQTIPPLLEGKDLLGQAQTGTGKTAAFALPVLSNLDLKQKDPQVLVLAPTRELAIQVAEAFQTYASGIKGFHVLPVYGGQDYKGQIRALQRGVHVVVGTPGRVMDHMNRGTLKLHKLSTLVLDEADEMLRMGFIDDVEWILEKTPAKRQIALFSATMPNQIKRIATKYLNDPTLITIKVKTATADTIRQRFWPVSGGHKLDALTRILEAEEFDGMIVFVRTKNATVDLVEKLEARGHAAAALSGDVAQVQRERTVKQFKAGKLDILVATDVAARGLDVDRVSHVVNFDIPHDTESYVHRIGRTGRAGRTGDAILFVAPREKRMLHAIEKATRQKIEMLEMPSTEVINSKRIERFKERITEVLEDKDIGLFSSVVEQYRQEHNVPAIDIAAALAKLAQGDAPLLLENKPTQKADKNWGKDSGRDFDRNDRRGRRGNDRPARTESKPDEGMKRYRVAVGHNHQVKPGNIVGAIANEAGIDSKNIGRIHIYDDYSHIDLPKDLSAAVLNKIKRARVAEQALNISKPESEGRGRGDRPDRGKPSNSNKSGNSGRPRDRIIEPETPREEEKGKPRAKERVKDKEKIKARKAAKKKLAAKIKIKPKKPKKPKNKGKPKRKTDTPS